MSDSTPSFRNLGHILQSLTIAALIGIGHYLVGLSDISAQTQLQIANLNVTVTDLKQSLDQYNLPQLTQDIAVLKSERARREAEDLCRTSGRPFTCHAP